MHDLQTELRILASCLPAEGRIDIDSQDVVATNAWSVDDWLEVLAYHGVGSLIENRSYLPSELKHELQSLKALAVATEALKKPEIDQLLLKLEHSGCDALVFKGCALAYSLYEQPWQRPRTDIDILIEPHQIKEARHILAGLGYRQQYAVSGELVSYQATFEKKLSGAASMNIDLHWRINNRQVFAKTINFEELRRHSNPIPALSDAARMPNYVYSLLLSCIHRAGHHNKEERMAWLYDIYLLANTFSLADWKLFTELAIKKEISAIVHDALQLCATLFDMDISHFASAVDPNRMQYELSSVYLNRHLPEWRYFLVDMQALPSYKERFQLLIENIVPSVEYVKRQMGTDSATKAYTKRTARGIKRVIR